MIRRKEILSFYRLAALSLWVLPSVSNAIDCGPLLAALAPLEHVTLDDPSEVLNAYWTTTPIVQHNLKNFSEAPREGVVEIAAVKNVSKAELKRLETEWKKQFAASKDVQSPGFYDRLDSVGALESRAFVSYLTHSGINVVGNLLEGKHGGYYNDTVLSLAGDSPANRLARVVYHRTGLLVELSSNPRLHVNENDGRIYIPKQSLTTEGEFQKNLTAVLDFVKKQSGDVQVKYQLSHAKWVDSKGNVADFRKLEGKKLEVNFGLDGTINGGGGMGDLREAKIPYVGTVPQYATNLSNFSQKFGPAAKSVRESIERNVDVTLDRFGSQASGKSNHYVSLLILDHATGKVGNFRVFSGDLEERKAEFEKIEASLAAITSRKDSAPRPDGKKISLIALQSSTSAAPIDPESLSVTRAFVNEWRRNGNLKEASPDDVDIQVVNVWTDPDHPSPVVFYRPLNLYPTEFRP